MKIAVVGLSAWYPCGDNLADFWANLLARRRSFRRLSDARLNHDRYHDGDAITGDKTYIERAALIDGFDFDWVGRRIPKRAFDSADLSQWLALEVAIRAVEDAGYERGTIPRERTMVVVGNTLTGEVSRANGLRLRWPYVARALETTAKALGYPDSAIEDFLEVGEDVFKSPFQEISEHTLPGVIPNTIAGRICNYFDFKGGGYAVDGACASSLIALVRGCESLMNNDADIALAAGVDISIDPFELVGFSRIGALAKDDMYVYEQRSQGFLPGEGCGVAVLKRLADARRDGDHVYAVIDGWGMSSDGKGGLTAPSAEGQALAVGRAWERAGVNRVPDFVEGHGTGTVVGDDTELAALQSVLTSRGIEGRLGVTALKSLIGHTKAAAGIGSFIKAVLAVDQRIVPPHAACTKPHRRFEGSQVYPLLEGEVRDPTETLRAGVSSFGFGGINVHIAIESGDAPHPGLAPEIEPRALFMSAQDSEVFMLAADDPESLVDMAKALAVEAANISLGEMADLSIDLARRAQNGQRLRAAMVAARPDELAHQLSTLSFVLDPIPDVGGVIADPMKDFWVGHGATARKIGFLFPGQGSQVLGMARWIVERYDWARELVALAEKMVGRFDGQSLSEIMLTAGLRAGSPDERKAAHERLTRTEICQPAICLASLLYARWLQRVGITPSAVGGHSLGELTAFCVAGAFDEARLFELAALRGSAMAAPGDEAGTMASLKCSRQEAEALVHEVDGYVVLANINSDQQMVVSGAPSAVELILEVATMRGIAGRRLSVSNAFHSDFVKAASIKIAASANLPSRPDRLDTRLFTSVDGSEVSNQVALTDHFGGQIVRPVDFVALGASMAQASDLLIEVGPNQVLSSLVSRNAAANGVHALPTETDVDSRRGMNRILAACFVRGIDLDVDNLFERRLVRPYIAPSQRKFITNPCEAEMTLPEMPAHSGPGISGRFASTLVERSGLESGALDAYLEQRGGFIADVIRADVASSAVDLSTVPKTERVTKKNGASKSSPVVSAAPRSVESILVELISERTGFPADSIRPEMTLLNDLNIESIAAGETIGRAAHLAGAGNSVDPGSLLQASVREVAAAIDAALGNHAGATSRVPGPDEGGAALLDTLERLEKKPTWVRAFEYKLVPTPVGEATREKALDVSLVADEDDTWRHALQAELMASGMNVTLGVTAKSSVVVCVLPELDASNASLTAVGGRLLECAKALPSSGTLLLVQRVDTLASGVAFASSLHHERPHLVVRIVEASGGIDPTMLAKAAATELVTAPQNDRCFLSDDGGRFLRRPRPVDRANCAKRSVSLERGDVVLVTGGARGATAEIAIALGERVGVKVALVGRSALPGDDEMRGVFERLAAAGVEHRYYACDVANGSEVADMIAKVRAEMGAVRGVVHGAGMNRPGLVGSEPLEASMETVFPKVSGLMHLLDALAGAPPAVVIGLSSIIGSTGMPGNAWYGFANEALDRALIRAGADRPDATIISLGYSLWNEVGMGKKLSNVASQIRAMGTSAIPVSEAVEQVFVWLEHDPGVRHMVIAGRLAGLDTWIMGDIPAVPFRFGQNRLTAQPGIEIVSLTEVSLASDPYLVDHVYKGTVLLPMVIGLEGMAQAVATVLGRPQLGALRIEDIDLSRPIVVDREHGERVLVHAEVLERITPDDPVRVRVGMAAEHTRFADNHFTATFVLLGEDDVAPTVQISHPSLPLELDPTRDVYGRFLFHGPAFQRLRNFYVLRSDYCVFESARETNPGWVLGDPFFTDSLMQAGQVVVAQDRGLPRSIKAIEFRPPVNGDVVLPTVEGCLDQRTDEYIDCTITAVDGEGRLLQRLERCRFAILEHLAQEPTAEEIAAPSPRDEAIFAEKLARAAKALGVDLPSMTIANEPGLQARPAGERHPAEHHVFERAMTLLLDLRPKRRERPDRGEVPRDRV